MLNPPPSRSSTLGLVLAPSTAGACKSSDACLHRYGIDAHVGRDTAHLALAAELPASVLGDLTGTSISTAEHWSQWAKRDWVGYVVQRAAHNADGVDSRKPAKQTL
jgi:hypothetical protein